MLKFRTCINWYTKPNICIKFDGFNLTHWGQVTHICFGKLIIIGSNNGLSPWRRQAIIWTNAGILLIGSLGTNFSEIIIGIQIFSTNEMQLKMSSGKWRPFCLGLNVLKQNRPETATHDRVLHQRKTGFINKHREKNTKSFDKWEPREKSWNGLFGYGGLLSNMFSHTFVTNSMTSTCKMSPGMTKLTG